MPGLNLTPSEQSLTAELITNWHLPRQDDFIIAQWDGDYSLFDRLSGQTHLLTALPAEILQLLLESGFSNVELAGRISSEHDIEVSEYWQSLIDQSLQQLNLLGLIESRLNDPR